MSRLEADATVTLRAMDDTKECPLCCGTMRLHETQSVVRIPGNLAATTRTVREWLCPDCDHFEEADEEGK